MNKHIYMESISEDLCQDKQEKQNKSNDITKQNDFHMAWYKKKEKKPKTK